MALSLSSPVKFLKGVGPKRAEALQRLSIRTAGDLLYHVPHRYLDATTVTPLARVSMGQDLCGSRGEHGRPADASRVTRVSGRAEGRQRPARVRLAGPAVSRAADQEGPAAARHGSRALLSREAARPARVYCARGGGR